MTKKFLFMAHKRIMLLSRWVEISTNKELACKILSGCEPLFPGGLRIFYDTIKKKTLIQGEVTNAEQLVILLYTFFSKEQNAYSRVQSYYTESK
jgi:hypothetical protein